MSDIGSDTRSIAERMTPWRLPPGTTKASDIPDSEALRVHALRLADAFNEVRDELGAVRRENAELRAGTALLREALERAKKYVPKMRKGLEGCSCHGLSHTTIPPCPDCGGTSGDFSLLALIDRALVRVGEREAHEHQHQQGEEE